MKAVAKLDENDADVLVHRKEHLSHTLICALISSRVGIAPGKTTVTATFFPFISSLNDCEKEVSAPFVALYIAK